MSKYSRIVLALIWSSILVLSALFSIFPWIPNYYDPHPGAEALQNIFGAIALIALVTIPVALLRNVPKEGALIYSLTVTIFLSFIIDDIYEVAVNKKPIYSKLSQTYEEMYWDKSSWEGLEDAVVEALNFMAKARYGKMNELLNKFEQQVQNNKVLE